MFQILAFFSLLTRYHQIATAAKFKVPYCCRTCPAPVRRAPGRPLRRWMAPVVQPPPVFAEISVMAVAAAVAADLYRALRGLFG